MNPVESWCELCMCDDLVEARAVATTISAMEFDCRVLDAITGDEVDPDTAALDRPYRVEVHPDDRDALGEVLEEIRREQTEFDTKLAARDEGVACLRRIGIGVLIAIVALLATLRIIQL